MKPRVIVMGRNYSTPLGVVRSLSKAGYDVDVVYISVGTLHSERIISASKYIDQFVKIEGKNDETVLNALLNITSAGKDRCLLFPTDDYTASLIDINSERLKDSFAMPHIVNGSIVEMMDKARQSALAKQCGLNTAREWIISLNTDSVAIPEDVLYPCFIKPLVSAMGGKSELEKCENRRELEKKLGNMQKRMHDRCVMVQEFLNIKQEYTIGGVCNDQEILLPAVIKKTRVAQHNRGVTLSGILIGNEEIGADLPAIIAFLKSVHYVGMFDLEVMMTDRGLFFGELNLRCGGPSYAYFRGGINLPVCAVQAIAEGRMTPSECAISLNQRFLNNKVAWEDYSDLYLNKKELKRLHEESDFTLLADEDDPEPERLFNTITRRRYDKQRVIKRAKRMIKPILTKIGILQ